MKRILLLILAFVAIGGTMELNAQWLKKLGKKVKDAAQRKVEQRVEQKTEDIVDDVFDGNVGKGKKGKNSSSGVDDADYDTGDGTQQGGKKQKPQSLEMAYAKSDFVPGDEIIFEDDLVGEQLGEFPSQWDLNEGNAEVVNVGGTKAICLVHGSAEIMPLMKNPQNYLPDVFTFEMDVYIGDGSFISEEQYTKNQSRYHIYFYTEDRSHHHIDLYDEGDQISWSFSRDGQSDLSGQQKTSDIIKLNDWNHLAFSFNKRAFKGYINGTRVINVPNVNKRPVRLLIWDNYQHHHNDFITNVRIAKGAVPLYERMMTDGKIITYGITFDTGKSTIKPESMGEINRIVQLMTENPELKFSVEGHTDTTGKAASNQTLSEARAQAIVDKLVELGIAANRLTAVGKGQTSPIADNSTDEGRAKNRRVEFVKQ